MAAGQLGAHIFKSSPEAERACWEWYQSFETPKSALWQTCGPSRPCLLILPTQFQQLGTKYSTKNLWPFSFKPLQCGCWGSDSGHQAKWCLCPLSQMSPSHFSSFKDRVSYNPGWSWTYCVATDDFDLSGSTTLFATYLFTCLFVCFYWDGLTQPKLASDSLGR